MDTSVVVELLAATLPSSLLGALLASVLALAIGARWIRGRAAPAALGAFVVVLPALVMAALAALSVQPDLRSLGLATAYRLGGFFFAVPPMVILAGTAAVTGARSVERGKAPAALVLVLVLATAATALSGGFAVDDLAFPLLRALLYLFVGLLVAVGALGSGEGHGPAASAAAGTAYALFVGLGEISGRALGQIYLLMGVNAQTVDLRAGFIELGFAEVLSPMLSWHLAVVVLAALVGPASAWPALRSGRTGSALTVIWVFSLPFFWIAGDAIQARVLAAAADPGTPS